MFIVAVSFGVLIFLLSILFAHVIFIVYKPIFDLVEWSKNAVNEKGEFSKLKVNHSISEEMAYIYKILNSIISQLNSSNLTLIETEKNIAVSDTMKMVAHDLRRPFSLLVAMLDTLSIKKSSPTLDDFIEESREDILKTLDQVNGMIQEILDDSLQEKLSLTEVSIYTLLENSLKETFSSNKIIIEYDIRKPFILYVDEVKIQRVISNIISNAVEAVFWSGKITN